VGRNEWLKNPQLSPLKFQKLLVPFHPSHPPHPEKIVRMGRMGKIDKIE